MALISPQTVSPAGPAVTTATVGASDTFAPERLGALIFRTTGTGATITFTIPGTNDLGQNTPDPVVTMGATDFRVVSTAQYIPYRDSTGVVTYTTSSQTGHTVAYILLPPA